MYGDLLTEELECDDKYTLPAEKVSAFFEWIVAEFPSTKFVMVTDDDAYVRVDKVVAKLNENIPSEGLYIGELLDALHPSPLSPVRDPTHPYYTSRKSYPLQQFPPYASGPHYLVSMDCVRFVGKNRYRLASLGGDDTSVGLWLLVIQVHVQYSAAFASMRLWPCKDKLLSFADLSPLGIRSIHSNLLTTRRFCHNFDHIIGVIDGLLLWKTYLIHSRSPFLTKLATQQGMESVNYSEIHNFQQSSINTVITINCSTTKKYLQSTRMRIKVLFSWLLWGVCSVSPIHDSITGFRLVYPTDGSIETIPLEFRTEISVDSIEEYKYQYRDKVLCIELQGLLKKEKCSPLMDPSVIFDALPPGNYTARAFITSTGGDIQYYATSDTVFTVVSKETLAAMMTRKIPEEQGLIEWAVQRRGTFGSLMKQKMGNYDERDVINNRVKHSTSILTNSDILLVIGVKTAVVKNFALRQAIRETWGSANVIPHDVKVFFVGCVPTLTNNLTNDERQQIQQAIELEKLTYGDLLTDELRCEDSYGNLPNKVKEFLHFASYTFPHTPFVMVADDDIYLRVDRLVDELRKQQPSQRLYIGQVWDALLGRRQEPVRETTERYYIPQARYPLHTYPPFAFGPHYLLSMDCARFIAKNSDKLRGLGAMDDVSVALWLLTIQVHVEHTLAFSSLRIATCKNSLLSLADLSSFGIRSIHENLVEKRGLCYGFDRMGWLK